MTEKKLRTETFNTLKEALDFANALKLKKDDIISISFNNEEVILIYIK